MISNSLYTLKIYESNIPYNKNTILVAQMAEEDSSLLEDMGQPLENDAQPLVENNEEQSQDELPVDEDG
ncbi:hypothetical protein NG54_16660, partial [Heyndrickxia ginsengihumi]